MTNVKMPATIDDRVVDQDKQDAIDLFLQLCDLEEDELLRAVERLGSERLDAERAPR